MALLLKLKFLTDLPLPQNGYPCADGPLQLLTGLETSEGQD